MDNGRLKMENYKGVLYCEAYLDIEYTVEDINAMICEVKSNFTPPVDVILNKVGSYSLSSDAQAMLAKNIKEFRNFVYVVDNKVKMESAKFSASNYMEPYNTKIAESKNAAYKILEQLGLEQNIG